MAQQRETMAKGAASVLRGDPQTGSTAAASAEPPNPFVAPSISLPKGGGAIRGIGEKFAANPVTGTGSMTVPIATSPGRANFGPQLSLSYDSGAGNGPFGFGWTLGLPAITRKTDKGLPRYRDAEESDVFLLSGAEDLVPEMTADGQRFEDQTVVPGYTVHRYRPRIEAAFARIERWTRQSDGDVHWRALSRDNVLSLYGVDSNSRIVDPTDARRVFSWLISETRDDKGNVILHEYKPEDGAGVALTQSHERNRGGRDDARRSANRHLRRIRYGNRTPLLDADGRRPHFLPPAMLQDAAWLFEVVLDYGEHDAEAPKPGDAGAWPCRNDPFSSYRAGFEVRTYRLCRRILMFHHFPGEDGVGPDCLVRSTDFAYREDNPVASFLTSVTATSYRRQAAGYLRKSMPPLDFGYSMAVVGQQVREVEADSVDNLPDGAAGPALQWVDLDGEGLTGLLAEQNGGWFYKRNESPLTRNAAAETYSARFAPLEPIARQPVGDPSGVGRRQFLDLAGDGQLDLVTLAPPVAGFHERDDIGWSPFRSFDSMPNVAWSDPNLRFVDLTGDGHADILITEDHAFTWHASLAEAGFGPAQTLGVASDEERGPRVVFADETETIFLADLAGDGLSDIVRIRNGEVSYWPNLGYGRFGAKVAMDSAPWFDTPDQFDASRLRLADIDGSGVTDIIYLGRDRARFWFNQSGNGWGAAQELAAFPAVDNVVAVTAVDLLGNGTACLAWSSPLKGSGRSPMKYLALMAEGKPHLLTSTRNNLGAETQVGYAPSTYFYLKDRREGHPWVTRLPFPVHVVERVETLDRISRNRFVTRYAYHHGYFDGTEREFHGFGMVEQFDTEEFAALSASDAFPDAVNIDAASHVPPVHTKTWFHIGAFVNGEKIERHYASEYFHDDDVAPLPDTLLPATLKRRDGSEIAWRLTTEEIRQACRALKGAVLRQETYARDGNDVEGLPYAVSESNYTVELLQPGGRNRHAAFFMHPREAATLEYERKLYGGGTAKRPDPRISHAVTLATDGYGNVLRTATIGYGRRLLADDPLLSAEDRQKQAAVLVTSTESSYTNAVDADGSYQAPQPAEARNYEILKAKPSPSHRLFQFDVLLEQLQQAGDGAHDLPYEDVTAVGATQDHPWRRLIEHSRMLYRRDDLNGALPTGALEALALPFEGYRKAFTPGLAHAAYVTSNKLTGVTLDAVLASEGRYVQIEGDTGWWIPSGRFFLHPESGATAAQEVALARQHFFMPRRYRDAFQHDILVRYDDYDLLALEIEDALLNKSTVGERDPDGNIAPRIDYRLLQPALMTDPNGNRSALAFDVLGLVTGTAVMGKVGETLGDSLEDFAADLAQSEIDAIFADPQGQASGFLGNATTRIVYDVGRYHRNAGEPQPSRVASIVRERHLSDLSPGTASPVQVSLGYSDGFGREIQRKLQAEPGPVEGGGPVVSTRWVGSGWTVFNNKARPVRQYEPFFSVSHEFEFARIAGVSPILFYDPMGRAVATLQPNHTYQKALFDPWRRETWDLNDTVTLDPLTDPDVAPYFMRLPPGTYTPTWFALRTEPGLAAVAQQHWPDAAQRDAETQAAHKAASHAITPTVAHYDSLGRAFLVVTDAGGAEKFTSRTELDIEGNQRAAVDPLGRVVVRYDYDMQGQRTQHASMEGGTRWVLSDVAGKPIRGWDGRSFMTRMSYDQLQRPTDLFVTQDGVERLAERTVYGEDQGDALNHRTRIHQTFDGAGVVTNVAFDFKANLLESRRRLLSDYKSEVDWQQDPTLDDEAFVISTNYDALNRPVVVTAPDGSVRRHAFNEANLLDAIDVVIQGDADGTNFVADIAYNAKGQREFIRYGNDAQTTYEYDEQTFRLLRLRTARGSGTGGFASGMFNDPAVVQDLHYTYDPAGNVIRIVDRALRSIAHDNQIVEPVCGFTYDALYRLIEATGREHVGQIVIQTSSPNGNYRNHPFVMLGAGANDLQALRNYTEHYEYDGAGNVLRWMHQAKNGDWTRLFEYQEASLLEPSRPSNRLSATRIGEPIEAYDYDVHGNVLSMPHLAAAVWDFEDQLQRADLLGGGMAHYIYAASGQRVRKVIEPQNGSRNERIYLNDFEIYREYDSSGVRLERHTLHVTDGDQRIAMVDLRTIGDEPSPPRLQRYQLGNQLDSASLELDDVGLVISYEEYHPYGTTSFQAMRSGSEVGAKRYRYIGKERDEETGLYYHGARYYSPWLGRWLSCDPSGIDEGTNLYHYVGGNPCTYVDLDGRKERAPTKKEIETNNRRQKPLTPEQLKKAVNQGPPRKPKIKGADTGGMGGSQGKNPASNPPTQPKPGSSAKSPSKPPDPPSAPGGDPSTQSPSTSSSASTSGSPSGDPSASAAPSSATQADPSSGTPGPSNEMTVFERISHELTGLAAILNLAPPVDQPDGQKYGSPLGGNPDAPNDPTYQFGFAIAGVFAAVGGQIRAVGKALAGVAERLVVRARLWWLGRTVAPQALAQMSGTKAAEYFGKYVVYGNKALMGKTMHRNIWFMKNTAKANPAADMVAFRQTVRAIEKEAMEAGADRIVIRGHSVLNQGFLSPKLAKILGYEFKDLGNGVVEATKLLTK